jgi:outer membrane protein assembly factor BamB
MKRETITLGHAGLGKTGDGGNMRIASLAVAVLASASWSCSKSSDGGLTPPSEDSSANFTGTWTGTQTGSVGGSPVTPGLAVMEITREGSNQLRLGGVCLDASSIPARVLGPATMDVPAFNCPAVALTGCAAVTAIWTGGSGTLSNGVLSLQLFGALRGCGQSFALVVQFDAMRDALPPGIVSLSPGSATVGEPGLTLTVTGTGFGPGAIVRFDGVDLPTTFVSGRELRAPLSAAALASARSVSVTVTNVDGQSSLAAAFEVRNPVPTLTATVPDTVMAGSPGVTLTLSGTGFVPGSTAAIAGSARPTTYLAATRLRVSLAQEDLIAGGELFLTVTNPGPGGGTSGAVTLHVGNPAPVAERMSPRSIPAGGSRFFVTVTGSNFVPGTSVTWNGAPRRTLVVSTTLVSVEIVAADVAQAGSAAVSVQNPSPGGGSAALGSFTIEAPAARASRSVAYQVDPAHSGRASSGGVLAFPGAKAWSVVLPDLVSYPLVADGKVFVLVRGSAAGGYGTRLQALDLATGATAWGPVAISGTYFWAGHAYEGGRIFVVNFDGRLSTFDAATGAAGWSVGLPGQYAFSAAPSAVGGVVYVGGAGSGGTVYAVDASTGAVLWTQGVANGDESSPAVAPDALFVSYPCQVYKLDLLTGSVIWHSNGPCSGGGGKTAAYDAGALYVRDISFGGSSGAIFDGFDGSSAGTFGTAAYLPIPALAGGARYELVNGALERWDAGATRAAWTFGGDGTLDSAPIVIDDAVVVGAGSGKVFAVDAVSGLQRWSDDAGAAILGPDEQNVSQPLTGFGAGGGYLVVPAGNRVTAWRIVAP